MASKRVWVNEYIIWGQGKVERVSGWVDLIFNQYKSKLMPVTNSVNRAMAWIAKSFLVMFAKYYTKQELTKMWLTADTSIEDLINEDGITFQLTSLALLEKEEWVKDLLDNLGPIGNFMGWIDSPNINAKELLRAILTKEVDLEKLIPADAPIVPAKGGQQWQSTPAPQLWWPAQAPQWGTWDLAALVNNLQSNQ